MCTLILSSLTKYSYDFAFDAFHFNLIRNKLRKEKEINRKNVKLNENYTFIYGFII